MSDFRDAIRRAVELVGGQAVLAKEIGCAQSEVSRLCNSAVSISPKVAIAISKATNGRVAIADLMPEVVDAVAEELGVTGRYPPAITRAPA